MTDMSHRLERRSFLKSAAGAGAGVALAGHFTAFGTRAAGAAPAAAERGARRASAPGYGPLFPTKDQTTGLELLKLPRGFEYLTFGWTGDPMADGTPTPSNHDGMAAFRRDGMAAFRRDGMAAFRRDGMAAFRHGDEVRLVRNHEKGNGTPFAPSNATYDPAAGGGTTTMVFDPDAGALREAYASLSGTIRNCAGGPQPAGTWLTCEETTLVSADGTRHGYVFEVPATGLASAVPLKAMGRFSHEATATDPATGIVYETEDAGSSALYRYVPGDPANLAAGGLLEAMALAGTDTTVGWTTGTSAAAEWVTVDNPDWAPGEPTTWQQASAKGAARIIRGEGAWYGNGLIYVVSTSGGPAGQGQVFAYDPVAATFTCVFASPSAAVLNAPDNVTVSPRGGLVLCEDGSGRELMHGMTPDGEIFPFAENNVVLTPELRDEKGYSGTDFTGSEWAGATFEPKNGNWLFANIQSPGITFAITGPWRTGAL
ncbi:MAG TPA: alkaline phosphatase PhoX [Acidimicrobiales bacterium]|nr:alkaline phosphatase PhoX [Acidimicrobiales bacterium]